jgi:hypothetical protein
MILQLSSTTPGCIGLAVSAKGICSEVRSLINPQLAAPSIRRAESLIFFLDWFDQIGKRLNSIHATGASAYLYDLSSVRTLSSHLGISRIFGPDRIGEENSASTFARNGHFA